MALSTIQQFKAQLADGGARPSLFEMYLKWPTIMQGRAEVQDAIEKSKFHCRISEIPGTSHNPITLKYAGREIKYAGQRVFQNLTVTIINDERFTLRRALETWFEAMNTRNTNRMLFPQTTGGLGYEADAYVVQYNKQGGLLRGYNFVDLFPVNLAPIALDWSNDGAIEDYTCEFAYQYWEPNTGGVNSLNPSIGATDAASFTLGAQQGQTSSGTAN